MHWTYYALAAAIALAAADLLVKAAAGKLPDSLGMLLYGITPFLTGVIWVFIDRNRFTVSSGKSSAIFYAIGVGVMFTLVTFCMYAAFWSGAPISLASPLIRLGGLLVASVAGIFFWHEPFTMRYALGVVLACAGLFLMVTR